MGAVVPQHVRIVSELVRIYGVPSAISFSLLPPCWRAYRDGAFAPLVAQPSPQPSNVQTSYFERARPAAFIVSVRAFASVRKAGLHMGLPRNAPNRGTVPCNGARPHECKHDRILSKHQYSTQRQSFMASNGIEKDQERGEDVTATGA